MAGFLGDPPISLLTCRYHADSHRLRGDGGLDVPLADAMRGVEDGQEVVLGVRAEHVNLPSHAASGTMRGRVSHVEPRIADRLKIVYIDLAAHHVAAKLAYDTPVTIGEMVTVRFDPAGLL